jgi:hypothetical protein
MVSDRIKESVQIAAFFVFGHVVDVDAFTASTKQVFWEGISSGNAFWSLYCVGFGFLAFYEECSSLISKCRHSMLL